MPLGSAGKAANIGTHSLLLSRRPILGVERTAARFFLDPQRTCKVDGLRALIGREECCMKMESDKYIFVHTLHLQRIQDLHYGTFAQREMILVQNQFSFQ